MSWSIETSSPVILRAFFADAETTTTAKGCLAPKNEMPPLLGAQFTETFAIGIRVNPPITTGLPIDTAFFSISSESAS